MNSLEELIRGANLESQKILGPSNAITEMLKAQERSRFLVSGFGMYNSMFKALAPQAAWQSNITSSVNSVASLVALATKFQMPTTAFDAITAINKQHEKLFSGYAIMSELAKSHKTHFHQINNLMAAVSGISNKIAGLAAVQKQWDFLDDFKIITEAAVDISESITSDTSEDIQSAVLKEKLQNLNSLILSFFKRNKKLGKNAYGLLSVVAIIISIHQYYYFLKPHPEPATQDEIVKSEKRVTKRIDTLTQQINVLTQQLNHKLQEQNQYKVTLRKCNVMLKPKLKSLVLSGLPTNYNVSPLVSNQKWILISYSNPKDNLMETGWVLKKYLSKSKH